jgi:hypothetical protein
MVHCEKCNRYKRVLEVQEDNVILLCGHIVQRKDVKAHCYECDGHVPIKEFKNLKPVLECGHERTEHDEKMDKVMNEMSEDFEKNPEKLKFFKKTLEKLLEPGVAQDFMEWKRKNRV